MRVPGIRQARGLRSRTLGRFIAVRLVQPWWCAAGLAARRWRDLFRRAARPFAGRLGAQAWRRQALLRSASDSRCTANWLRALGHAVRRVADGRRVFFMRRNTDPGPVEFQVVVGWSELLTDFK